MSLKDKINRTDFKKVLNKLGYVYFDSGNYNINIIGIRSKEIKDNNIFDDYIVVEYKNSDGNKCRYIFPVTTNPGKTYLQQPCVYKGCAIVVPGQYRAAYEFGLHKGKYRALIQCKPIKVYRDKNKDTVLDMNPKTIEEGMFGCNIHKAGTNSQFVNNWSAGCQVFKKSEDFTIFLTLCNLQKQAGLGDKFTYTLIDEKDLGLD